MIASVVRGIGSVLTVVVAILVTTRAGETTTAKILTAAISATVLVALEWFVRWSPGHLQWARHYLDERSVWTGIWVQPVKHAWSATGNERQTRNSFSVFRVLFDPATGYSLVGRGYDIDGNEVAEWWSREGATFSRDGRRLSYAWQGKSWDENGIDPARTGLATLKLWPGERDSGTGEVQHVGSNLQLDVQLERVTGACLKRRALDDRFSLPGLNQDAERQRFAKAWAQAQSAGQSSTETTTSQSSK